jgi:hypothetical protein
MVTADEQKVKDLPAYWLLRLEMARERHDFVAAARARDELARLGVRVIYGRPRPPCGGAA